MSQKILVFRNVNTITIRNLNALKFHLKKGTQALCNVLSEAISDITNWQFLLHSLASGNKKNRNTNDCDENKAKFKVSAHSSNPI